MMLGEVLPPVGDNNRAKRWKAARRQRGKIEAQREKEANNGSMKRLKVSDDWVAAHAPALRELCANTPAATPEGRHTTRQSSAGVARPGGGAREYNEEVRYSLPHANGEPESAAERRNDRHRRREQLALERLEHAPERELRAERAAAETAATLAAARLEAEAEKEARERRKASVVRDGNTLYAADIRSSASTQ